MILTRFRGPGPWAAALLVLSAWLPTAHAELFEWTDDQGRVHYSNEPRPGSQRIGLAPIALEPVGGEDEATTDTTRRDRRTRGRADRQLDSQDARPAPLPDSVWHAPSDATEARPAAPAPDAEVLRERECQRLHGMSCLRYRAWGQTREVACPGRADDEHCPPPDEDETRPRAAEIPRPPTEHAWPVDGDPDRPLTRPDEPS